MWARNPLPDQPSLVILAFLVVPAFWSIWLSFNRGGILDTAKYVGLDNWRAISNDSELTGAIKNTGVYVIEAVLLVFTLAIVLALLLGTLAGSGPAPAKMDFPAAGLLVFQRTLIV